MYNVYVMYMSVGEVKILHTATPGVAWFKNDCQYHILLQDFQLLQWLKGCSDRCFFRLTLSAPVKNMEFLKEMIFWMNSAAEYKESQSLVSWKQETVSQQVWRMDVRIFFSPVQQC